MLLGKLFHLRSSGVQIHLESETTEDQQTCFYLKRMLAQDPAEGFEWTITITDGTGRVSIKLQM